MHPDHMVASQNDYRRGDGNCYGAYSLDGGHHWSDTTIPMSFTYGATTWGTAREYWQAGGDTSVAWDTKGNAYLSCQVFNRGSGVSPNPDQSSAFYVFRSTGNNGASWNFPGRPVVEYNDTAGSGAVLLDKNYLTVDNHVGSPFQDRVYVTWTTFAADGTAYIYEAHSSDYGETFSSPVLVSKDSSLCPFTYGIGDAAGQVQREPVLEPVHRSRRRALRRLGQLQQRRHRHRTTATRCCWPSPPTAGRPSPPRSRSATTTTCPTATPTRAPDPGRACVPEKGPSTNSVFRATNYPVGDVNPKNPTQVVVSFGSYINQHSKESNGCTPHGFSVYGLNLYTGVKTPGACNNDILLSVSNNGGATFTGTSADPRTETTVNPDPDQAKSDQFWQWQAFNKDGKLAVDYYDRQYGHSTGSPAVPSDEYTGSSDITLSGSKDLVNWGTSRVTSSSMPPPTQFAGQFYGDYIGMDAVDKAAPIWADTATPSSSRARAPTKKLQHQHRKTPRVVDLRALELARVVDVDRLPLGEDVERRLAGLAVAVAGRLDAAERQVHLGAGRAGVDVGDPGLEVAHRAEGAVDVAGVDRGREPVLHRVRRGDRLLEALDRDQRGRRPEDLLLRDPHLRVDVGEHRRAVEEAVAVRPASPPVSSLAPSDRPAAV